VRSARRPAAVGIVLLALAALAGWPDSAVASGLIRVALVERTRHLELTGIHLEIVPLAGPGDAGCCAGRARGSVVRATAVNGGGVEIDGRRAPAFRVRSDAPIRWNGREYPAPLEVVRDGEGIALVNELPLEDYLAGVLRAEASERWPAEMLRAQAIAARTYAAHHRVLGAGKPYHIVASTAHQLYIGRVPPTSPVWAAVRDTAGQVLLWEGEVFPAFYHTESGGFTEDPRTVFAARNMPALRAVRCEFSGNSPHFYWNLDLRLADLADALRRNGADVGAVSAIEVTERTMSLRAATVVVTGSRGATRLRGNDFRRMVGYDTLKSTLFAVVVEDDVARFSGRGYGHGVGMCQWGAKGMAEQGYTARQILELYYPGTTFSSLVDRAP
jgi:stage II sporulation protein D